MSIVLSVILIHAPKPVTCENCHRDKSSVSIPQWNRHDCHDVEKFGICRTDHGFHGDIITKHNRVTYFERS